MNAVVVIPAALETVRRDVTGHGGWVAVNVANIRDQQVSSRVQVVIENGGVGQRDETVVGIAIPTRNGSILNGPVAVWRGGHDVQVLVAVKITHDGIG